MASDHTDYQKFPYKLPTTCSSFGFGRYGQLGSPCQSFSRSPCIISLSDPIFSVSAGDGHSAILSETHKLFTFGKNTFGQLGLGHRVPTSEPSLISYLQSKKIESVSCGAEHTLALTNDGEVYSWGLNLKGQLGLGDTNNRNSPTLVESVSSQYTPFQNFSLEKGERVVKLSCGGLHSLLLTDRSRVFSCGHGANYALGTNSPENLVKFAHVKLLEGSGKIEKLQAGLAHSAAIVQGNVFVWGKLKSVYTAPTQVFFDRTVPVGFRGKSSSPRNGSTEDIACGENCCLCVVKGEVWVWGEGLGRESEDPVKIEEFKNARYISAGLKHAVVVTNDYKLYAWGNGDHGQCAEVATCAGPVLVQSYAAVSSFKIVCGSYHTLVISEKAPQQASCGGVDLCSHAVETRKLKKELQDLKTAFEELKKEGVKRGTANSYLEKNPVSLAKNSKHLSPQFEIDFSELTIDPEPIGRGGYGTVYKGKWRGTTIALKKMKLEGTNNRFNDFIQECQTMLSVRHPNIILFMGACVVSPNYSLILEYCGNGSLWDVLRNHSNSLPWYMRCKISLDIARGVNYLHKFPVPVLHRDLKSLNILLDDAMNAKLADFGWTRFKAETMTNKIGTYQWMAPEVIQGEDYSEKADVYSFGIILWELATRKPPFRELNGLQVSQEVVKNDLRPPVPKRCPEPFLKLMQKCWSRDPSARPEFEMIIEELEAFLKFLEKTSVN